MRLSWNISRDYEAGVDRGVYYPIGRTAEVWNGLVSVTESPVDLNDRVRYIDGRKYVNLRQEDSFSANISAFTYPTSLLSDRRIPFGLSYRVQNARGYKTHLVYNALAHISGQNFSQDDNPNPISFDISTRPSAIPGAIPSAHLVIDSIGTSSEALVALEDILYGNDAGFDARLPLPDELVDIFEENAQFKITDNGDGTFTIEAPDEAFDWVSDIRVKIEWPKVTPTSDISYQIRSW